MSKLVVLTAAVSPAELCDFVSMKLEGVHELFQVCRICGKGVVFYNMAQYSLLYHKVSAINTQSSIYSKFAKIICILIPKHDK